MKNYRTMILDADAAFLNTLTNCFSEFPRLHIIDAISNGAEALNKIHSEKPDVLLMDILLPGLDGISLLKELHALKDPPAIVCLSEFYSRTSVEAARKYGADYFLVKPLNPSSIARVLLECADLAFEDRQRQKESVSADPESEIAVRIQKLLKDLGFSPRYHGTTYLAEAVLLLHQSPMFLRNLNNGLYQEIAERMHTTPSCIERSIRTAIAVADTDKSLTERLGCAPTNKACIRFLLNELKR